MMERKKMIRVAAVWLLTSILLAPSFVSMADETSVVSRTLSVLKVEGENARVNRSGVRELDAFEGMTLCQGDCVTTGMESGVYIQADDDKTVKMDQNSMVEISRVSSKKLKMTLKSGELFFHVENHLEDDETVEFDAAGTTLSIRGTAGLFSCHGDQVSLYLLEGTVVWTVDGRPVTIRAGQKMTASVAGENGAPGLGNGQVSEFTADDLNAFELGAVLEHRDRLEIPAGVGLAAAAGMERFARKASELKGMETEALERAEAESNMILASLPQTEAGSGSYEIVRDEGSDDDSHTLTEAPEQMTEAPGDVEEAPGDTEETPRPQIRFVLRVGLRAGYTIIWAEDITNIPEGQTGLMRLAVYPWDSGVKFADALELMEAETGIFTEESLIILDEREVSYEITDDVFDEADLREKNIRIQAVVYTDEEEAYDYSGCMIVDTMLPARN